MKTYRRWGVGIATIVGLALLASPAAATEPPPWLEVRDGISQPVFDFAEAIEETVYVESAVDTDRDGRRDRIAVRISRPGETETEGIAVPVIFHHSPYRGPFGNAVNHPVDVDELPQESRRGAAAARGAAFADLPGSLDNYYVPRGYAVVLGASVGTDGSDGCPTVGDMGETLATTAVIDWLNGRAQGYDASGAPVSADWTTGAVGMYGVSYDGTLANMAATTGVEGLETIVPVSAISSWYDYYRANGLVVAPHSETQGAGENVYLGEDTDVLAVFQGGDERMAGTCADELERLRREQDRITGDFSAFWWERDYLRRAAGVGASVFVVHGLNDWNVKTKAFASWWERLAENGVERKLWLHNGGHGPPPDAEYRRTVHRWLDHWLFGVSNGILGEPRAFVQHDDGSTETSRDWPLPDSEPTRWFLGASSAADPGTLGTRRPPRANRQRFVDRGRELDTDDVLIADPGSAHPNRLVYVSSPLRRDAHLSGTPLVALRASVDNRDAANLTAVLVDYGRPGSGAAPRMVTRGWIDVFEPPRARLPGSHPAGPRVHLPLRPAARRLRLPRRFKDRPRRGVNGP